MSEKSDFKCGYVGLIGRPNAGKSTLLNSVLGSKLAITSAKPQTTRNRIAGVHTDEQMQVILVDTPGIHKAWTELNKSMVERAVDALADADVACWIGDMTLLARRAETDNTPIFDELAEEIAASLEKSRKPVIFVANKIDVIPKPLVLPVIAAVSERLDLAGAVPISALTGDGVPQLMELVRDLLPAHPPLFPEGYYTDVTERFLVAEIIREKIFHLTEQEIPYSTFVEVEQFDESERESDNPIVRIHTVIVVERKSQKGIVIGKGGEMLKRIGSLARKELQKLLGCRVYLNLFVKVERDWTRTRKGLRRVGYDSKRRK